MVEAVEALAAQFQQKLASAELDADVNLKDILQGPPDTPPADLRFAVELALRQQLADVIDAAQSSTQATSSAGPAHVAMVVRQSFQAASHDIVDSSLPAAMLETALSCTPVHQLDELFNVAEDQKDDLALPARLKVLNLLAYVLPLSERSGVNLLKAFNIDNTTAFAATDDDAAAASAASSTGDAVAVSDAADVRSPTQTEAKPSARGPNEAPIDFRFYQTFWEVQQWFSNPPSLLIGTAFDQFAKHARVIISAFESNADALEAAGNQGEFYYPKFLTASKLMNLQLRDVRFRRSILVQFLIACEYLQKQDPAIARQLTKQRRGVVSSLKPRVLKLLRQTPPDGQAFTRVVQTVLAEEQAWVEWKNSKCAPFERAPPSLKRKRFPELPQTSDKRRFLGNATLSDLWAGDSVEMVICDADYNTRPTPEHFLAPILDELEDEMLEPEERRANDKLYSWKAMRLLSTENYYVFAKGNVEAAAQLVAAGNHTVVPSAVGPDGAFVEPDVNATSGDVVVVDDDVASGKSSGQDEVVAVDDGDDGDADESDGGIASDAEAVDGDVVMAESVSEQGEEGEISD